MQINRLEYSHNAHCQAPPRWRGSATRVLLCKSKILFAPNGQGNRQLAVKFAPAGGVEFVEPEKIEAEDEQEN